jgi:hypothetical protein
MPIITNKCESERINRHKTRVIFSNYVIEQTGVLLQRQLSAEIIGGSGAALEESGYVPIVEGANFTTAAELSTIVASAEIALGYTAGTVPGAPTNVTGTAGNAQVTVTWSAPSSNGGSPITRYTVRSSPGNVSVSTTSTSAVVTGLTNNTAYTFTVTATNAIGTSAASAASGSVTPFVPNGSILFNGTTAYAFWNGAAAGVTQFTVECFFYSTDFSSEQIVLGSIYSASATSQLIIAITNSTTITISRQTGGTSNAFTVPTMSTNTWYHLVYVRGTSNTATVFLAGTRSSTGTVTDNTSYDSVSGYLGANRPLSNLALAGFFKGNISNFRWVISTAVYNPSSTSITVPTSNLAVVGGNNTQILLNTLNDSSLYLKDTSNFTVAVTGVNTSSSSLAPF